MMSLQDRLQAWHLEPDYLDGFGKRRLVAREHLEAVLDSLEARHGALGAMRDCIVVRGGRKPPVDGAWTIRSPMGSVVSGSGELPSLEYGIYRLECERRKSSAREIANLIVAPERAWQGESAQQLWAIGVQLYGVRSASNWGHGDFRDLARLLELASEIGAAGVALNPLHALFDDDPEQASPYSPNSRLFLNPLYIDVEAAPGFPGIEALGLGKRLKTLRARELIDYSGVAVVKLDALRASYAAFRQQGTQAQAPFEAFRRERGAELARFVTFEVLRRRDRRPWRQWDPSLRRPNEAMIAKLRITAAEEMGFHEYVQWVAESQLEACQKTARQLQLPLGLYLDLAVGVAPSGADAWGDQDAMLDGLCIGAPPDAFNTAGQNWGLTGFSPHGLANDAFHPFARMLAAAMRHAGAIRLDHVLGLNRLFVVPQGASPQAGAYLRFPLIPLLAIIAQESVRHRCLVIGEDLGTVPDELRDILADWGLWSYRVMLFERAVDGTFLPPETYPENALVTFSTHDLPTFAGWCAGHDLAVKRAIGIDPGETETERQAAIAALQQSLRRRSIDSFDFGSVVRYLASTPSRLLVISLEDFLGVLDQPNIPNTINEHPNWRRRLPIALEELPRQPQWSAIADALRSRRLRSR
jgi:4-alpha-glucanotransferase